MKIIDHGTWSKYTPKKGHPDAPVNTMYCRRDSDEIDWYEYQKKFDINTIKCTVFENVIQAVTRDASAMFPQNCRVIEIFDIDTPKPHDVYSGKEYDPKTNTLV